MSSPIRSPEGHWWNWSVGRQEKAWLGLVVITGVILFGWMFGWMYAGEQNPTGPTYRVSTDQFRQKMADYRQAATETDLGLEPAADDIYVAGAQFGWHGLPVVLEAGKRYQLHLSSLDVQHGFSVRPGDELWKQINLQALPGYEWVVPMRFEEPGTYYVVCNEFCGVGHRVMTSRFYVVEEGSGAVARAGETAGMRSRRERPEAGAGPARSGPSSEER